MRITPLNIALALLVAGGAYLYLEGRQQVNTATVLSAIAAFGVLSFADLIFRARLKNLKRIWIAEILFLIFAAVSILIIKTI